MAGENKNNFQLSGIIFSLILMFMAFKSVTQFKPFYDKLTYTFVQHPTTTTTLLLLIMAGTVYWLAGKDMVKHYFQVKPQNLIKQALAPVGMSADRKGERRGGLVGRTARSTAR